MALTAIRPAGKMRGRAHSWRREADDGHWYVVKLRNNPRHRPITGEQSWSASTLRTDLKIRRAPRRPFSGAGRDFLAASLDVHLALGTRALPVEAGWQFGARYPGDPVRNAVYDFLPDTLLGQVSTSKIFAPSSLSSGPARPTAARVSSRALWSGTWDRQRSPVSWRVIDHGFAWNGPNWDFPDSLLPGLTLAARCMTAFVLSMISSRGSARS
ncbi:MAG TPA: hypothetical protein VKB88_02020 [Bryobacteraceae bacterium]|nr:hypothetical protein [Bryobacteraceae bacterium]